jgi:hypothetical protein
VLQRAVRDGRDLRAAGDEVARGGLADLARAEEQDAPACELAEDLLRERRRSRGHRGRALPDRRLDAHALADVQGLPEEPVEERPRRAGLVRRAHLAEDLALAGHERVEPAGDAEEMQRRALVAEPVERRPQLARAAAREPFQRRDGRLLGALLAREVELCPVARREDHGLLAQVVRERRRRRAVERDALAQLDRGAVVRDADEGQLHAKWVSGRTTATSAKPARLSSAARRPRRPSCRSTSSAR